MFLIPWETLAAEMTKKYDEKAKFAGARMMIAQTSAILASYLPTLIINQLGGKDSPSTFLIMAAIFGGLFSLVVLLVVLLSWERPYTEAEKLIQPEPMDWTKAALIPVNMFRDLFSTLKIKAFRQHLSLYLGGYISQDIFNTAFPLFVATVMMGATLVISQLMTTMYVAQLISVMIAVNVVIRTGPTTAYRMAISFVCAALVLFLAFYMIKPAGFAEGLTALGGNLFGGGASPAVLFWLFVPIILAGLGRGTLNFVPWSVYNYLPDVDEAVTGQRREGIFAGVMTFVRKIAQSGAIVLTTSLIGAGGFVSAAKGQPGVPCSDARGGPRAGAGDGRPADPGHAGRRGDLVVVPPERQDPRGADPRGRAPAGRRDRARERGVQGHRRGPDRLEVGAAVGSRLALLALRPRSAWLRRSAPPGRCSAIPSMTGPPTRRW
jgi:oligogalacturonide transporter